MKIVNSKIFWFSKKHHILASVIAYGLIAIVFTYPLITKFSSAIPEGGRDSFLVMGQIESRSEIVAAHGWLEGIKIIIKNREFNSYLPYIIVDQLFHNKFATNNLLFLLSFIFSGWGAYLLAFYFTENKRAAFLAGIIFAFSSFHVYQSAAIHLGMRHQELIPFFVLFLFRFFENFKVKYFALTGLFAFLIAITEHQLLAFTAIFTAFFVIYILVSDRTLLSSKKLWLFFFASVLFLGIVAVSIFGPLLKVALSPDNFLNPGIKSVISLSIIPSDVLFPPEFHGIWPNANEFFQESIFHTSHKGDSYYAGIVALGTVFLFLFWLLKDKFKNNKGDEKNRTRNALVKFWLIEVLVFFVISMGPITEIGKWKIYLPYYLIYKYVPFYVNIRVVGRFFVFVVLGLSVLFAFAAQYFMKKYPGKKNVIVATLGLLLLLDFWVAPMKTDSLSYSPFYDKIGKDTNQYKLLEIPGSTDDVFFNYEWITRNVHHKELVNGMPMAREVEGQFDFQNKTPVIKQLLYTIPRGLNPEKRVKHPEEYYKNANEILNRNNIAYITISKKYTEANVLSSAENFIEKYIKYDSKYEDEYLVAYKVANVTPNIIQ
jgi:hypothetical protein